MTAEKKNKGKKEDKRKSERFAWLGPLMERRKADVEPIEDDVEGEDLEEIKD